MNKALPARMVVMVLATLLWSAVARGQDQEAKREAEAAFVKAFGERDYELAEKAARAWAKLRPDDFIPHYNLACALAQMGRIDEGAAMLDRSVELGMVSKYQLVMDGSLTPLHGHETYARLIATWDAQLERAIDARLDRARKAFPKNYHYVKDPDQRLAFASGFDPALFERARGQMNLVSDWWKKTVLPDGTPLVVADGTQPDPWVMVTLPARADFARWSARNFGPRSKYIPGIYDNQHKELVAQDLGATLRHEFCHVLHYRDADRRGQVHAVWLQEGLCSLVEDIEVSPVGVKVVPSWRTNAVKRTARVGRLIPLAKLVAFDQAKMTREGTAIPAYALARATCLMLAERDLLRPFYAAYVRLHREDPTGAKALEEVMQMPLAEIDTLLARWALTLPDVPDAERPGRVRLPVRLGATGGDGVTIEAVDRGTAAGDLRAGDVVVTVNGEGVHDQNELARVLGRFAGSEEVEV
ncbi:MAG: hypothetical protein ACT4PL_14315, partial [Phycisphaerales bacterium]